MLKNHGNSDKLYEVQFIYLRKKEENTVWVNYWNF
jgi:hypothetical protein